MISCHHVGLANSKLWDTPPLNFEKFLNIKITKILHWKAVLSKILRQTLLIFYVTSYIISCYFCYVWSLYNQTGNRESKFGNIIFFEKPVTVKIPTSLPGLQHILQILHKHSQLNYNGPLEAGFLNFIFFFQWQTFFYFIF